jgi:hypothetical protein
MKKRLLSFGILLLSTATALAQCADGEIEITMNLYTDAWAYENYWELTYTGTDCGADPLDFGANTNVGCEGTGADNSEDGYDNNSVYTAGPWCFPEGTSLDLIFVDSYGDGGLVFEVFENGVLTHLFTGTDSGNTWTFEIGNSNLPVYDSPCGAALLSTGGEPLLLNNETAIAAFGEIAPSGEDCAIYGFWCEGGTSNTVWAYFEAEEGMQYQISTCVEGTTMDTQLALWKGNDCAQLEAFELITANDDAFGGCEGADEFASTLFTGCLEAGAVYYILVDGWYGSTGDIVLQMTAIEPEVNLEGSPRDTPCPLDKTDEPEGQILIWLTESNADFSAQWTGPNGFTASGNFIENLVSGTYQVEVLSSCGVVYNGSYTLDEPAPWNVVSNIVSPDCEQSENGAIDLTVSGGTPDYTFFWTGPNSFNANQADIEAIAPGQYGVLITDDNECEYTIDYLVEAVNELTLDLGPDTVVCQNVVFAVTAPVGYTYLWQDESQNQFFLINAAEFGIGDHYLICTITSDDGCSAVDVFNFTVDACIGVDEKLDQAPVVLYPNPTKGNFRLEWKEMERAYIIVRDALGKTVHTFHSPTASTGEDVHLQLPTGYYTVLLQVGNAVQVLPLVVE